MLEVVFHPHSRFHAQGADLYHVLPLAPWKAALGALVSVDLPGGRIKVRIPEGAQSGGQLRVRGKGIPSNPPGDLVLNLKVVLLPANTPKSKQLYEEMARELAFDPRRNVKGGDPCTKMTFMWVA